MAPLPIERIDPQLKPFEVTCIDILGPLRPTVNGNVKKIYIMIFVCALTRYIHLHLLDSLESLRVLEGIVSFWTAYGPVRKFISDNATNFKRTAKTIREDEARAGFFAKHQPFLGQKLSELYKVEWQFIAVHAPWFGGNYERLIKDVKYALGTTLERRKINRVELNIAVQEAAHRINCRPLTDNSLDSEDGEVLTPHHLVKGRSGWPLLPGIHRNVYSIIPEKSIYRRGRIVTDEIMRRFTARFLPELTRRAKWHKYNEPARVGDLVLVIEPNKTRKQWERAKIIKLRLGRDGIARVADVRMFDGRIKKNRAVRNLAKLSLSKSLSEIAEKVDDKAITTATVNTIFEFEGNQSDAFSNSTPNNNNNNKFNKNINKNIEMNSNSTEQFVLIEGIDSSMKLSTVIQELAPEFTSIVAIFRIFDYIKRISSDDIIIQLLDPLEYAAAMKAREELNETNDFKVHFPDLVSGTAYFPKNFALIDAERIAADPKPLYVFDLPKMRANTSPYLSRVLRSLEDFAVLTGFKWNLGNKFNVTRNFGFAFLCDKAEVMRLAGQRIMVGNESIRLNGCSSTAVLIHKSQKEHFNVFGKTILTPRISQLNWLNADVIVTTDDDLIEPQRVKVTINNELATHSASDSELKEDTVVLNAETNELAEIEAEISAERPDIRQTSSKLYDEQPCTSQAAIQQDLQAQNTVRSFTPTIPLNVSRFLRMKMYGNYPFATFHRLVMQFVMNNEDVVYFERSESSVAYIVFKEVSTAAKFKKLMEKLDKKDQVKITYAEEKTIKVIEKVKLGNSKPKEVSEIIYHIDGEGNIKRRAYNENFIDCVPGLCE